MELVRLPVGEAAARRFSEQLWLPYHRDLEATISDHALIDADDAELLDREVEFRLGRLAEEDYRVWVAVDGSNDDLGAEEPTRGDSVLAGFITTTTDRCPSVFDRPDRLVVGDIYVREPYRGSGLAHDLMACAAEQARETDCPELTLDVDTDNERALAFYEKLGFEPLRQQLRVEVDEL